MTIKILIVVLVFLVLFLCCSKLFACKKTETYSKWKNTNSKMCKKIRVEGKHIYKYYPQPHHVVKIQDVYDKYLVNFPFVPRMSFDLQNNIIKEDYYETPLTSKTKPKDYIVQLKRIDRRLRNAGLYQNDYKLAHFFVDNHQIKLIDWSNFTFGYPKPKASNDMNKILHALDPK